MKTIFGLFLLFILSTVIVFAQKKSIEVKNIQVDPNPVKIGNMIKVTVEFSGKRNKLKSVELYSREYGYDAPEMKLVPDINKKMNIWSFEFQVPYDIPAGIYNMELKAVNKKGVPVESKSCDKCVYGKTAEIKVTVTN